MNYFALKPDHEVKVSIHYFATKHRTYSLVIHVNQLFTNKHN